MENSSSWGFDSPVGSRASGRRDHLLDPTRPVLELRPKRQLIERLSTPSRHQGDLALCHEEPALSFAPPSAWLDPTLLARATGGDPRPRGTTPSPAESRYLTRDDFEVCRLVVARCCQGPGYLVAVVSNQALVGRDDEATSPRELRIWTRLRGRSRPFPLPARLGRSSKPKTRHGCCPARASTPVPQPHTFICDDEPRGQPLAAGCPFVMFGDERPPSGAVTSSCREVAAFISVLLTIHEGTSVRDGARAVYRGQRLWASHGYCATASWSR